MSLANGITVFFCCIIEVFLLYDYFAAFFELKVSARRAVMAGILAVICIFSVNMFNNTVANLLLVSLLLWIFVSLLFEAKLSVRLGYFVAAYIVMIGSEFLYAILSNVAVDILTDHTILPIAETPLNTLAAKMCNYIIFMILKQGSSRSKTRITNSLFWIYLCVPVSSLAIMIIVTYSGIDVNSNRMIRTMLIIFFALLIISDMLLFYAFRDHTENLSRNLNQQIEIVRQKAELDRLTKISVLNDNYNEIVHNTTHYLKAIKQLAEENKCEEIKKITEEINGRLNNNSNVEYCNNKMINTILAEYTDKAGMNNVRFDAYVEPGCIISMIQDIDLVTMIGNILDNAMTATQDIRDAEIVFRMFMQKDGELCIIKVVNDFADEIKEDKGTLLSTKKESGVHGIGLKSVSRIAEQYGGYFEYYYDDYKFNSVIILPAYQ